jgi:type II secretory pathway component PulF
LIRKMISDMPPASRALLALSDLVAGRVHFVLLGAGLVVGGCIWFGRTHVGRQAFSTVLVRLPGVKRIVLTLSLAQICRCLALLLNSGLTMVSAMGLTSATVAVPRLATGLREVCRKIVDGSRLTDALAEESLLPPLALSVIAVGEEAGGLTTSFTRLASMYDRDSRAAVKTAIGILEPAVTVILGVIVGGVAAIVITTLYKATQGVLR